MRPLAKLCVQDAGRTPDKITASPQDTGRVLWYHNSHWLSSVHPYFHFRMITLVNISRLSPNLVCGLILWRSSLGLLMTSSSIFGRSRWLSWMRRPTGDQEVANSTPADVSNILSWRLIMKYFLRSYSPFR